MENHLGTLLQVKPREAGGEGGEGGEGAGETGRGGLFFSDHLVSDKDKTKIDITYTITTNVAYVYETPLQQFLASDT